MKQFVSKLTCIYIIFYSLYSISTRFIPTAKLCEGLPADILYKTILILAGILAICDILLLAKTVRLTPALCLLAVFLLILGISTITNRDYELTGNVLGTATFICQLIVFYFLSDLIHTETITHCLKLTGIFTSLFWTPGCVISLYQYIWNIHYMIISPEQRLIRQGITDGRLFGLFSDPNFAAFTSLLIIILLIFAIRHSSSALLKGYSIICIILNLMYLIMSNSRTIYITAVGTLLFFVLFKTYREYREQDLSNRMAFLAALCKKTALALGACALLYAVIFFPIQGIGHLVVPDRDLHDMVREDVTTDNITNNRSTIWKNYLELYKDKPLFGFSIRSALPYATDKYPGSYLAITQYVTHNGYLSLLIETGVTGFLVMGAFFLLTFLQSLHTIRKKEKPHDNYLLYTALTVAVLIFLMCFHDVFFTVNFETMLLFVAIGGIRSCNESTLVDASSPSKFS